MKEVGTYDNAIKELFRHARSGPTLVEKILTAETLEGVLGKK